MGLATILLLTGIAAIIIEFFVPAFGLVGLVGAGSIIGSVITAFRFSSTAGAIFLTASLIIVPGLLMLFFKLFPKTFIGKKLILHRNFNKEDGFESSSDNYSVLKGKSGTVISDLRPAGTIMIDNKKFSAITAGEYIEKEKKVSVIKTEGSKIIVAEVTEC